MSDDASDLRALFCEALDLASSEQSRFLDKNCKGRPTLRRRLDALLLAHGNSGDFLRGSTDRSSEEGISSAENSGSMIDRYRLMRKIGEGGFGVVFLAEQQEPVFRQVALKVIKPGMDTRQVIARFTAERQALAMMDHPNIARVFDGGTTPAGHPYFVMELAIGVPITEYCDQHKMNIRDRLRLFVSACRAIQHAHHKGLIHCDLKPSNVLVTELDNQPVVKVIDFGIAKAIKVPTNDETDSANIATLAGSPSYMSPEQWPMSGLDVDTRSDVYSLGVLLYELLTGTTPFDRKRWESMKWDDLLALVSDAETVPPSLRVTDTVADTKSAASERGVDAKKLRAQLSGELDWIVLKSMERDRSRRYESASALGDDVERFMNDEHVLASPPSRRYRLGKLVRRHRVALMSVAVIAAGLAFATVVSVWAALHARQAEGLAESRLVREQQALRQAEEATGQAQSDREEAVRQRSRAEKNLQQARDVIDQMLGRFSGESGLAFAIPDNFRQEILGDALQFYQQFLSNNASDPSLQIDIAKTLMKMADAQHALGHLAEAEGSIRQANKMFADLIVQWPENTLLPRQREQAVFGLATYLRQTNQKLDEAETLYRQAIAMSETIEAGSGQQIELALLIDELNEFGHFLAFTMGRRTEAEPILLRSVNMGHQLAGIDPHPNQLLRLSQACNSLGILYRQSRAADQATTMHEEACHLLQQVGKADPIYEVRPEMARSRSHLGLARLANHDATGAEFALRQAIELRMAVAMDNPKIPSNRIELAMNEMQLAGILESKDLLVEAEIELRTSVVLLEKVFSDSPSDSTAVYRLIEALRKLGDLLFVRGSREGADPVYQRLLELPTNAGPAAGAMAWHLANCPIVARRNPAKAMQLAKQAIDQAPLEGDFWTTLGAAQYRTGSYQESITTLQHAKQLGADRGDSIPGFFLAMAFRQLGNEDAAEREFQEAQANLQAVPSWSGDAQKCLDEAAALR